jgi:hypothetical protein
VLDLYVHKIKLLLSKTFITYNCKYIFNNNNNNNNNNNIIIIIIIIITLENRGNVVGIATGYGLDDRGIAAQATEGSRIFSYPRPPDLL